MQMDAQPTTPAEQRDPSQQLNAANWGLNDFLGLAYDYIELNLDGAELSEPGGKFEFVSMLAARRALMQEMTERGFVFNELAWADQAATEERWQDRTTELLADWEASQA